MLQKEVWFSFTAQCWRVKEQYELFSYYDVDSVVGHFVAGDRPARVQLTGIRADAHDTLRAALDAAHVPYEDSTKASI